MDDVFDEFFAQQSSPTPTTTNPFAELMTESHFVSPVSSVSQIESLPVSATCENPLTLVVSVASPEDVLETLQQQKPQRAEMQEAVVTNLATDELSVLYQALPPLQGSVEEDQKQYFQRLKSMLKPNANTVNQQWPPAESLSKPASVQQEELSLESGPLQILRFLPEGDFTSSIPHVSVTFSQPMIALSTVDQVEEQNIPVSIEPKVEGKFKWLGTKTLVFEPTYRFAMSTAYTVTVGEQTKSITGNLIDKMLTFGFTTPRAKVQSHFPVTYSYQGSTYPVNELPYFYLEFDQRIDPQSVIQYVNLDIESLATQLISSEQLTEELSRSALSREKLKSYIDAIERRINTSPEGRHLWFKVIGQVPHSKLLQITVERGVPSLEGPLVTSESYSYTVQNYGSFKYEGHSPTTESVPLQAWTITFTNELDLEALDLAMIEVTPALPNLQVLPSGKSITISGRSKGRTVYTVTIKSNVQDIYGQKLQKDVSIPFSVTQAAKTLQVFQSGLYTIDPTDTEGTVFSIVTVNLDQVALQIIQVDPESYAPSCLYSQVLPEGKIVFDGVYPIQTQEDEPIITDIDLVPYLQHSRERLGQLFVHVKGTNWHNEYPPAFKSWIQVTRLAIDVFSSRNSHIVWANSLANGSIVPRCKFSVNIFQYTADEQGLVYIPRLDDTTIIARDGNDVTIQEVSQNYFHDQRFLYHIFNDRGLYKPNETISVKGFVREIVEQDQGRYYTIRYPMYKQCAEYAVFDSRHQKYHTGKAEISGYGAFSLSFTIPDNVNLGSHSIIFSGTIFEMRHEFTVQEFRTPEFKVSTSISQSQYVVNQKAIATVAASYYSGGGLNGADVSYVVVQKESSYSPPNWSRFSFSPEEPLDYVNYYQRSEGLVTSSTTFRSRTDVEGENQICIAFSEKERAKRRPVTISVEASVQDINRQTINSSSSFIVHPSNLYVGVKLSRPFVAPNAPATIEYVVTNIDGKPVANVPVSIKASHRVSKQKGFKYYTEEVQVSEETVFSGITPNSHSLKFTEGGKYTIICTVKDSQGLENSTVTVLYVFGGSSLIRSGSKLRVEQATLISDKESYQIGETADIFVQSPFEGPAEGILHVVLRGITETIRFTIQQGSCAEVKVPINRYYIPSFVVRATIVGSTFRQDEKGAPLTDSPRRPAYAEGAIKVLVPPVCYNLDVQVTPEHSVLPPGESTDVSVLVRNADGIPVPNSEVTLIAVDEAVLSLKNYSISNPLQYFYPDYHFSYRYLSSRSSVSVKNWSNIKIQRNTMHNHHGLYQSKPDCQPCFDCFALADCFGSAAESLPALALKVRTNFNPLAVFVSSIATDANGVATIKVNLPDSLTKYRVTAVAVESNNYFGLGESSITAQLPLSIRPSLPRFLNFGDSAEFSCVLQNQTDKNLTVNVAAKLSNLIFTDQSKSGYKVQLPSLSRVELRFPISTDKCGTGRFQIGAAVVTKGVSFSDAVERSLPIYTPSTSEAFATYGEIDSTKAISQPIIPPKDIWPQFGSLDISTSSTAVSALTDSFLYLYEYPFDCNEQKASRILSVIATKDILYAFNNSKIPSRQELDQFVTRSLNELYKNQRSDGAFTFWGPSSGEVSLYVTIHVAHCFARCMQANYILDQSVVERTKNFLRNIQSHIFSDRKSEQYSLRAYVLFVLALLNDPSTMHSGRDLLAECGGVNGALLSLEALAWIAFAIFRANGNRADATVNLILNKISNRANENAETAHFITSYQDSQSAKLVMLQSDLRTDAIILELLITAQPSNTLITKIVKGLLASRKNGRWGNTQDNVFILLALNSYFITFEKQVPDFITNIWFGEEFTGWQTFKGRETKENLVQIPVKNLISTDDKPRDLILDKKGPGRMYYRIGLTYAPKSLWLDAREYGFFVSREYQGVSDPSHVSRDTSTGVWTVKAGELIRVKITLSNTARRYHVALVDKLPGGFEVLNPDLATTGTVPKYRSEMSNVWWWSAWYEHQNLRDERVEAFTSLLWEGVHHYSVVCRATTLGEFIVPPAHAEEMYSPEVFGRSSSDRVIVKEY